MNKHIYISELTPQDFDLNEIKRYMGDKNHSECTDQLISECIKECSDIFTYRVCYTIFDFNDSDDTSIDLSFDNVPSETLKIYLNGCSGVVLFASTVGIGIDRLIAKYSSISPSKSLCFHSIGAERIEALCDSFAQKIKNEYKCTKTRISPGYGDFDISHQKEIFNYLNCYKNIGLTLNDSMIMSPSKSVTAIIGIEGN